MKPPKNEPLRPHDPDLALALAADILALEQLPELNVIDGVFYWNCCRTDFIDTVAQMRKTLDAYPPEQRTEIFSKGQFDLHLLADYDIPSEWAYAHVLQGRALALKPPTIRGKSTQESPWTAFLTVEVGTVEWSGARIAANVEQLVNSQQRFDPYLRFWDPNEDGTSDSTDLEIAFRQRQDGWVEIQLAVPLPSADLIARSYDQFVKRNTRWLKAMPDGASLGSGQRPDVAVRTWAIGLLVGSGMNVGIAISKVVETLQLLAVTPTRFNQDRRHLLAHVPQAERFLYQRPPRHD